MGNERVNDKVAVSYIYIEVYIQMIHMTSKDDRKQFRPIANQVLN